MLSKEEFAAFMALLAAFAEANGLSSAATAKVLGIHGATYARWISATRNADSKITAYHWRVKPVIERVEKLNAVDAARGTYKAIASQSTAERVALLQQILEGKIIW